MVKKGNTLPAPKVPKTDMRAVLLEKAITATGESRQLDFKGDFESNTEGWCSILKDIVAMANSGGGILVFGCTSNGQPSGQDCAQVQSTDIADFTNKIFSYTGHHFGDVEILSVSRGSNICPVLVVHEADIPISFIKPGEFEVCDKSGKKIKKTAFNVGSLYFRHGGKSEPAMRADLETWIARRIAKERKAWLQGMKKVVNAPLGHVVSVATPGAKLVPGTEGVKVQYSNDPDAIKIAPPAMQATHPLVCKQLMAAVKKACGKKLSTHEVVSLNHHFKIFADHPEFGNKPHQQSSPQYSNLYVDFLANGLVEDPKLLARAREAYRTRPKKA